MPCACSLTARTLAPLQTVLSKSINTLQFKNATRRRLGLCSRRAFTLAVISILLFHWPLFIYVKATQADLASILESHDSHVRSEHDADLNNEQERGDAEGRLKFWNRKFLRGTGSAHDSSKVFHFELPDTSLERALLHPRNENFGGISSSNRRMLIPANECTNKDISITQRRDGSPGIPRFSVQIVNTCMSDCAPADIHVYCGWFASSPPPNPNVFQRVSYDDCLVNGGRPLGHSTIIQFQYANSFMYPLQVRSARFCR
ncbi:uncharacterized protein [Physcomitrium patens]|uniref:Uncharacterized protein n=1 Tax=Physcomitrium patens TaxID=3218 RepID=A9SLB2_PHYPA|nr:uncharacterized protein LOC112286469 [Physcomitrium patens]XP_024384149.1 uncharacterized protein LOC112286469 [Physcomitrium patens]PNR47655.1 hypothetical protein PHYPA_012128 [Physcomitrium patens]|eukprot:XP_024384148.1 uncharacterized protein LOC112286469 [Physcomitrella patens]